MFTEFASLQLTREELQEIQQALIQRAMIEDRLRGEKGLEKIERRPFLEKFEMLLGEKTETLTAADKALEEELWEYSWYAFTDEWAWFRARGEISKELGTAGLKKLAAAELDKIIEARYRRNFDRYVAEVEMLDSAAKKAERKNRQPKGKPS